MVLDKAKVERNLKKKGFVEKPGDHLYLEFIYNGRFVCYTKLSRGSSKTIDDTLISLMAKQCLISKKDFVNFVSCTISAKGYIDLLKKRREI